MALPILASFAAAAATRAILRLRSTAELTLSRMLACFDSSASVKRDSGTLKILDKMPRKKDRLWDLPMATQSWSTSLYRVRPGRWKFIRSRLSTGMSIGWGRYEASCINSRCIPKKSCKRIFPASLRLSFCFSRKYALSLERVERLLAYLIQSI